MRLIRVALEYVGIRTGRTGYRTERMGLDPRDAIVRESGPFLAVNYQAAIKRMEAEKAKERAKA